jgi:hypothetical protein
MKVSGMSLSHAGASAEDKVSASPWKKIFLCRPRFGMRALLIAMTVAGVALYLTVRPIQEKLRLEADLKTLGMLGARVHSSRNSMQYSPGSNPFSRAVGIGLSYQNLYTADFTGAKIGDAEVRRVCQLKGVRIEALGLENTLATDAALDHVVRLPDLIVLDLAGTKVTDAGIAKLSRSDQLVKLDVSRTAVSYEALDGLERRQPTEVYFSQTKAINDLKQLQVQFVDIPLFDLPSTTLIRSGEDIRLVNVYNTKLKPNEFALLSRLKTVDEIGIRDCPIPRGEIEKWQGLKELRKLEMWLCDLSAGQAQELAKLPQLKTIKMGHCRISKEEVEMIRKSLPHCEVVAAGTLDQALPR